MSTVPGAPPQRAKLAAIEGLRGIAAMTVVVHHLATEAGTRQFIPHGYLAVDLFFAMSGFVIAQAYSARLEAGMGVIRFTVLRLVRLYPLFVLGQLFGLGVMALYGYEFMTLFKAFVLGSAILPWPVDMGGVPVVFPLNDPSWSLFFELAINIVFAATLSMLSVGALLALLAVSAMALLAAVLHFGDLNIGWSPENMAGGVPRAAFSFIMGILLYRFAPKVKTGNAVSVLLLIGLVPLLAIGPQAWWFDLLVVVILFPAMLFMAASWQPTGMVRGISYALGRISYPLYIIHAPALYWGWLVIDKDTSSAGLQASAWLLVVAATLLVSAVLPTLYDEPVRRFIAKAINRSAPKGQ